MKLGRASQASMRDPGDNLGFLLRSSWAALGDRGKDVWILGKALGCAMSFFGIVGQNCVESRM